MASREPNHDFILHRSPDGALAVVVRNPLLALSLLSDERSVDTRERRVEVGVGVGVCVVHHTRIIHPR